jgi:N-acetylglucosamine transport system substrate-binding protein
MRKLAIAVAIALAILPAGCGKKAQGKAGRVEIEVASFQGGFGLDFFEYAAREYEKTHPNVSIRVWGEPRIWEKLRPRFNQGDVPDLTWPGWGMDTWGLVAEGQVMPLEKGKLNGHYYILPFNNNVFGWWYNVDMFRKHGWQPPKTYEELLVLCDKIKKAGIAPMTYQGKYPTYMLRGFLFPWVISAGGYAAFRDAENLKPGAWNSPAFLKAAQMVKELADKGCFQEGAMGMDHTGSQMEFVLGHAAMIPCGTWLGSEMKKQIPPRFHMAYINPPVLAHGKGDPTATSTSIEYWIIPAKSKHPGIAADLFKFMTSLEMAKKFVQQKDTLMCIKGADQVKLPPDLVDAARCAREAKTIYGADYADWYRSFATETEHAMADLLNGVATPKQCVDRMEKAATETRNDKSIPKHRVE